MQDFALKTEEHTAEGKVQIACISFSNLDYVQSDRWWEIVNKNDIIKIIFITKKKKKTSLKNGPPLNILRAVSWCIKYSLSIRHNELIIIYYNLDKSLTDTTHFHYKPVQCTPYCFNKSKSDFSAFQLIKVDNRNDFFIVTCLATTEFRIGGNLFASTTGPLLQSNLCKWQMSFFIGEIMTSYKATRWPDKLWK